MKNKLGIELLKGANNAVRLLTELKMLHVQKKHLVNEAALVALRNCMAEEAKYRSAFDIFEEKRNIEELLGTIAEFNTKLAVCVESLKKL